MKKITLKSLYTLVVLGALLLPSNSNAQVWSAVGTGLSGFSYSQATAMDVYNGNLYIGGYFTSPGNSICKWNGSSLSSVGSGSFPGLDQGPQAMVNYNAAM